MSPSPRAWIRVTVAAGDRTPRDVVILAGTDPLTDPVAALEAWLLRTAGVSSGTVVRGVNAAGEIGAGPVDRRSLTRAIQTRCKRGGPIRSSSRP
jgi:hypothetical protein